MSIDPTGSFMDSRRHIPKADNKLHQGKAVRRILRGARVGLVSLPGMLWPPLGPVLSHSSNFHLIDWLQTLAATLWLHALVFYVQNICQTPPSPNPKVYYSRWGFASTSDVIICFPFVDNHSYQASCLYCQVLNYCIFLKTQQRIHLIFVLYWNSLIFLVGISHPLSLFLPVIFPSVYWSSVFWGVLGVSLGSFYHCVQVLFLSSAGTSMPSHLPYHAIYCHLLLLQLTASCRDALAYAWLSFHPLSLQGPWPLQGSMYRHPVWPLNHPIATVQASSHIKQNTNIDLLISNLNSNLTSGLYLATNPFLYLLDLPRPPGHFFGSAGFILSTCAFRKFFICRG